MVVSAESETATKPHVAVVASPGMGHIVPLFELAKRLVTHHGLRVSFLNITTEASTAQTQLLHSPDLPSGLDVVDLPPVDLSTIVSEDALVLTRLCINVDESFRCLKSVLLKLGKPNAVVIDLFCTQALEVCEELSIPLYSFCTTSSAFLAFSLYLPTMDREIEGEYVDLPEAVQLPGCSRVRIEDLLDQVRDRKNDDYKWFLYHVSRLPKAAGILINTWEDLEPVALRAIRENPTYQEIPIPQIYPVGPLIKDTEPLTASVVDCLAWLDKQPTDSVIFIALGSGGTLSTQQLTEFAWGLERSRQRFLWVVRLPSDIACDSASFFGAGYEANGWKEYLPEGFLERTKEVGLVVSSWAPQVAVLSHPSTGAFVSHCGWNSSLESIMCGVPMIGWPLYSEQRMNATMLMEDVGVLTKPVVEPGQETIGRLEIERLMRTAIEGEKGKASRRKAKELKESARKALSTGGTSYESLSCLTKQWEAY
ncbi:anthocyanidin 3-O-glucosyltransferase 5-like [Ziziphus jujuba]|uniref:Glycosyltransferase n=1 Tax=Ziziphus jujuba TaxID=326968 RepID=A0ABM3ILK9_ZIZJJ|nr:anthocyanidin 3-O-glucosyltransferase 5-like [Ziziphus jujuba]